MSGRFPWHRFLPTLLILAVLIGLQPDASALARANFQTTEGPFIPAPVIIKADPAVSALHVLAPAQMQLPGLTASSSVVVEFQTSGVQYGYTCSAFPAGAQTAISYAASIWGMLLTSASPVTVRACWANLGPGVLGMTGSAGLYRNFSGAPQSNTYYPVALANALVAGDVNGSNPEVFVLFSNSVPFYFGTDGNPPLYQFDLSSVALHEIAHGLGFSGSMSVSGGNGIWGVNASPTIYDRFTTDGSNTPLINYSSPGTFSGPLGAALRGGAGGVFFSGANALAANGGNRVKLYSPSTWASGSSYSHVDTIYDNTLNALMTYSLAFHEVVHDPGPAVRGMMKDFGWNIVSAPEAPSDLAAAPAAGPKINLNWTDNSTQESGFRVERSTDAANWAQVAAPGAGITTYADTAVQSGTKYWYRVYAYNPYGSSTYSNTANAITPGPPPAPTNLGARASGTDSVYLYWVAADNIGCTFIVEQSPDGISSWVPILTTVPAATEARATGLTIATQYFFRVKASSTTNGLSSYTGVVSATTWLVSIPVYLPVIGK